MTTIPMSSETSTAAVRRPILELNFSGESSGGGLASAVGALLGNGDPWEQHTVTVTVEMGLAPLANFAEVRLSGGPNTPSVNVGDTGSISLGYEDEGTIQVFTGSVESVSRSIYGEIVFTATDGGGELSKLRLNQTYEQQKAGDIVKDLADRVGMGTGAVEDGMDFPFYVLDDRRNAYRHVASLARRNGFACYVDGNGELCFAQPAHGEPVQTFTYGEDILMLQVIDTAPVFSGVTTVGEGAAGSQGQEAWSWLVKDPSPVKGTSGEDASARGVPAPDLRSSGAAQTAADGLMNAAGLLRITGKLLVPGAPRVNVGGTIEITGAPQGTLNGSCLVQRVRHHFSKRSGFTSYIVFSRTDGTPAGGIV